MSVTIGSFSASHLKAQPFGFAETNVARGRTARQWEIQGVVLRSVWANLLSTYDTWRNLKIAEDEVLTFLAEVDAKVISLKSIIGE
jgi:hypothetical protein